MNMKSTIRIVPATGSPLPATQRNGFTLVEMLIIIAIIVLLAGILVPALDLVRQEMKAKLTQSNINLIATACDMYASDFDGEYPPSTDDNPNPNRRYFSNANNQYGKKIIVLLLTGYAGDDDDAGEPYVPGSETMSEDDGRDGFGFRTVRRGRIYGPYNGTEKIPTVEGSDPPIFADAFGNPILYYLADSNFAFNKDDNDDGGNDDPIQEMLDQYESPSRKFLIISPGKNTSWNESGNNNDDLVNP